MESIKTAIVFYSQHHKNTKKLLDAIKAEFPDVKLIDVSITKVAELEGYNRIGIASGIYYSRFAKPLMEYLKSHLPKDKEVFAIYTYGRESSVYTKEVKSLVEEKHGIYLGEYGCYGFDTFGPFKLVGGIQKGHPTTDEISDAVDFYRTLCVE